MSIGPSTVLLFRRLIPCVVSVCLCGMSMTRGPSAVPSSKCQHPSFWSIHLILSDLCWCRVVVDVYHPRLFCSRISHCNFIHQLTMRWWKRGLVKIRQLQPHNTSFPKSPFDQDTNPVVRGFISWSTLINDPDSIWPLSSFHLCRIRTSSNKRVTANVHQKCPSNMKKVFFSTTTYLIPLCLSDFHSPRLFTAPPSLNLYWLMATTF